MGSEGYLLNQFLVTHTNKRDRPLGRARSRTACACRSRWWRGCARAVGADFILIYRLSMIDLVPDGQTWDEVVRAREGRSRPPAPRMINTGIGWHEARVPTIATSVPRAAFAWLTRRMMGEVGDAR